MTILNATELAARLNVSKARISQYVSEGKLDGCYVGDGRSRRFDLGKVKSILAGRLDPGQMMGNGAATRASLRGLGVPPSNHEESGRSDSVLPASDPDRYELARIQNAEEDARRKRRDNERDEGRWVLADEVERQAARLIGQEVAQFETVLRDAARAVADECHVDFREVRKIMMDHWRKYRGIRAGAIGHGAACANMTTAEIETQA